MSTTPATKQPLAAARQPSSVAVRPAAPAKSKSKSRNVSAETPAKAKRSRQKKEPNVSVQKSGEKTGSVDGGVDGGGGGKKAKDAGTTTSTLEGGKRKQALEKRDETRSGRTLATAASWKLSPYLGGRYSRLDPVFSKNEKHIFLAHTNTLKIFSTKTSLLVRTITLPAHAPSSSRPEHIVSYFLDPRADGQVYIATSKSRLFLWDWVDGEQLRSWKLGLGTLAHLVMCADEAARSQGEQGVVYAVSGENRQRTVWMIRLFAQDNKPVEKSVVVEVDLPVTALQAHDGGDAVLVITGKDLVVVNRTAAGTEMDAWAAPRRYSMSHTLTCMDVNLPDRAAEPPKDKKSKKSAGRRRLGDVLVGDTNGVVHVVHDVVRPPGSAADPVVRRLHWHRNPVCTAKWALEGNYIVSGGQETVLVLWQLETGSKQFLPHLGSTIERIVVSPQNSSYYAISLADNSVMVLSTTDLKPKANIAGIQSTSQPVASRARAARVPCVLHPTRANTLLLAAPSVQTGHAPAAPYLQTFDTFSDRHVARQALARTHATQLNQGPDMSRIVEAGISHLAISPTGDWLASVDEWEGSARTDHYGAGAAAVPVRDGCRRTEVFLKFWRWSEGRAEWELVSRVDSPHPAGAKPGGERILDLVAAPHGLMFVTVGADGAARVWRPKARSRAGVPVRGAEGALLSWGCRKVISFARGLGDDHLLHHHRQLSSATTARTTLLDASSAEPESRGLKRRWGALALSEDASVLAVAAPAATLGGAPDEDSLIHLLDPHTGAIRQTLAGLSVGRTGALAIIAHSLVVLGTRKLLVWNLVDGRTAWEYALAELASPSSSSSTTTTSTATSTISTTHSPNHNHVHHSDLHLAADPRNDTFAICIPADSSSSSSTTTTAAAARQHRVAVFTPASAEPIHLAPPLPAPVAALKPAGAGKGFLLLDALARVLYLAPAGAPHVSVAQAAKGTFSLKSDLEEEDEGALARSYGGAGGVSGVGGEGGSAGGGGGVAELVSRDPALAVRHEVEVQEEEEQEEEEEGGLADRVVPREALEGVFDTAPLYAAGPVQDAFERVFELFAKRAGDYDHDEEGDEEEEEAEEEEAEEAEEAEEVEEVDEDEEMLG